MLYADIGDIIDTDESESAKITLSKIVKDAFSEHYVPSEAECWSIITAYYNE